MRESAAQSATGLRSGLHPAAEPYNSFMLDVGGGHSVYVEECGKPDGVPVVVLHGGPGGGCTPGMRRFFDPGHYRAVLFDQRGCGRSRPHASVENNTTWDLVADIERIRGHLGIGSWLIFGGSWGSTLALLYAQEHPDRVKALILRGIFTMTRAELDWFYGGGAARFWPREWAEFVSLIPEEERGDLISAYGRRLFSDDESVVTTYAEAWAGWENALAVLEPVPGRSGPGGAYARAFARLENHYFRHGGFLKSDDQIMANMAKLSHIPGIIVQGRYDMVCPPARAFALAKAWPGTRLELVGTAGHALSEPGISAVLAGVMDELRQRFAA
jgi:proline iminopeptidase